MFLSILKRKAHTALRDLRHGGLLVGNLKSDHPDAFDIQNSGYEVLDRIFAGHVRRGDILADLGCGKGRVLNWWMDNYPVNRAFGLEIDEVVGTKTQRRLQRNQFVHVLIGDAVMMLPSSASLLFLSNPFGEETMRRFAERIMKQPRATNGLPRRIVYYHCTCLSVFLNDDRFSVVPIAMNGYHPSAVIDVRT